MEKQSLSLFYCLSNTCLHVIVHMWLLLAYSVTCGQLPESNIDSEELWWKKYSAIIFLITLQELIFADP